MNVKGLKMNKELVHRIYNSISTINKANFKGIEVFNSFQWAGFNKEEFTSLLSLFTFLDDKNFFNKISDDHPFIFNYSTDVTEMDIVTVMSYKDVPVLIDIESKNGNEPGLFKKIKDQLDKRKNDHIPQMIKNNPYLSIGFVNNEFVYGYFFDGSNIFEISNVDRVRELLSTSFDSYNGVEEYLLQSSNIASIAKICSDIKNGSYKFYEDTNRLSNLLVSKIDKDNAFIVYGNAGTGKSVLALKLFFENENTKMLMMNSKLYFALNFNQKYYYENRATFNSSDFLNFIDKNTISIIDECQRLPIDYIVDVVKKSKITFLFGDNRQACFKNNTLLDAKDLAKKLTDDFGLIVESKKLTKARRYSDLVDKSLSILSSKDNKVKGAKLPSDYRINLFYDEKKFIDYYGKLDGIKKIYVPINQSFSESMEIAGETYKKAEYNDDGFSIWPNSSNYYGTTYHALSFDIDHCFIYLTKTKMITKNKKQFLFYKEQDFDFEDIDLYLNELNVLFTRGKKSLNIYIQDIEAYLYLNNLISKLK